MRALSAIAHVQAYPRAKCFCKLQGHQHCKLYKPTVFPKWLSQVFFSIIKLCLKGSSAPSSVACLWLYQSLKWLSQCKGLPLPVQSISQSAKCLYCFCQSVSYIYMPDCKHLRFQMCAFAPPKKCWIENFKFGKAKVTTQSVGIPARPHLCTSQSAHPSTAHIVFSLSQVLLRFCCFSWQTQTTEDNLVKTAM